MLFKFLSLAVSIESLYFWQLCPLFHALFLHHFRRDPGFWYQSVPFMKIVLEEGRLIKSFLALLYTVVPAGTLPPVTLYFQLWIGSKKIWVKLFSIIEQFPVKLFFCTIDALNMADPQDHQEERFSKGKFLKSLKRKHPQDPQDHHEEKILKRNVPWNLDVVKNCILESGYICSVGAAWCGVRGFVGTDT